MKRLIPISVLLVTFFTSNAQFENIDLSQYKLPYIKRHQLDFGLQYNNDYSKYSQGNSNNSYPDFFRFNLNNDLNASYSYYLNSDRVQIEGRINLFTEIDLDWQKIDKANFDKYDNYHYSLNASLDRRMYFNGEDKWFFLWAPSLNVSNNFYYNKEESNYNDSKRDKQFSRNLDFQPGLKLGGGIGRIEPVGDLRRAIYILEDLFENDRLNRLPSESEIIQFADKVAQLRNQRFFDSRLRRIYEIKSLDSLLNQIGLVDEMDATYFTSLNDMWSNGNESRYSGNRIQFNILGKLLYDFNKTKTETYNYNQEKVTDEYEDKFYNELMGMELLFNSYKPVGLKWLRYLSTNFYFNRYYMDLNFEPSLRNYNRYSGNMRYYYYWFLNTRTSASLGVNGYFYRYDYSDKNPDLQDQNNIQCIINGSLSYYFSPRLKASLSLSMDYSWTENIDISYTRRFNFINQMGINYALF